MIKKSIILIIFFMYSCVPHVQKYYYTVADTLVLSEEKYSKNSIKDTVVFMLESNTLLHLGRIKLKINNQEFYNRKLPKLSPDEVLTAQDSILFTNNNKNVYCWIEVYLEDKHIYMEKKIALRSNKVAIRYIQYPAKLPENIYRFLILYTD